MPDISDHIDPIVAAIYEKYEQGNAHRKQRPYLGASVIGRECARALWYGFRWASVPENLEGRKLRLFKTGDLEESRMVADLRAIGATVYDVDPTTGKQFEFKHFGGHMQGHMDGCANNIIGAGNKWHVLEFKTHNEKSFKDLQAKGVEKSKPEHYAQMQWYMGQSGMERALYLAKNKNDEALYSERIKFDMVAYERINNKAEKIIFSDVLPPKISEDPKYYLCSWCEHNAVCHSNRAPAVSCRSCVHATPERDGDGRWSCAKHEHGRSSSIPVQLQRTGCGKHLPLPFLVTYAEAIDAGDGWIQFKRKDNGREFVVADSQTMPPPGMETEIPVYTTQEISAAADHRVIADPEVEKFRAEFPGSRITG